VRLAEEGRHEGDDEQGDEPGRVHDEPRGEGGDGDDVLRLPEELAHERHPPRRLAAGALQPVLRLGVLEVLEVECGGVLHELHARHVREALAEQRVDERDDAPEDVGEHGERELDGEQQEQPVEQPTLPPPGERRRRAGRARAGHHLVDDQLADVERGHRQHRAHEAQGEGGDREGAARPPDEAEEGRHVAQRAEALAQRAGGGARRRARVAAATAGGGHDGGRAGCDAAARLVVAGHAGGLRSNRARAGRPPGRSDPAARLLVAPGAEAAPPLAPGRHLRGGERAVAQVARERVVERREELPAPESSAL
jgi:hypothetical protein